MPETINSTRHRQTRLGWQVVLIAVFCMLGAALQGLNLLIVLAAVLLGAMIVQWRVARATIDWLDVQRRLPGAWFAGVPTTVVFRVTNRHWLLPFFLVRIEDVWMRSQSRDCFRAATAVAFVPPRHRSAASLTITIHQRGRYKIQKWRASTIAPFGFSVAWRDGTYPQEDRYLDVYPRLVPMVSGWQRWLPHQYGVPATTHLRRQGSSDDEFFGMREYRRGDSRRHIHWRTTARIGKPAVRQHEQQRQTRWCLLVDAFLTSESSSAVEEVERAISLAATMIVESCGTTGGPLGLVVAGTDIEGAVGGASREGARRMLRLLAEAQPCRTETFATAAQTAVRVSRQFPDLIILSTRSYRTVMSDDAIANAFRPWVRRRTLTWIDVTQPEIHRWMVADADEATSATRLPFFHSRRAASQVR